MVSLLRCMVYRVLDDWVESKKIQNTIVNNSYSIGPYDYSYFRNFRGGTNRKYSENY